MTANHKSYPNSPGYRRTDTSYQAAQEVAAKAKPWREIVFESLAGNGPATSFELAERLDIEHSVIQPRTSELRLMNRIEDSGERRMTKFGKKSIVWRVKENGRPAASASEGG
jgi:hypothetical protein